MRNFEDDYKVVTDRTDHPDETNHRVLLWFPPWDYHGGGVTRWYPDQEAEADYHPVRVTSSRHYTVIHSRSSFLPISKMTKSKRPVTREM